MEVALFGNPNTGKTSLFNILTGSYAFVGNWSGVTVEKKVGQLKNHDGRLVDLPGLYALAPLSSDETVATRFLLRNSFTSIINIVDASQMARNLQLTIELLEFGKPMVIGLNMVDVAKHLGIVFDTLKLSECLRVPVVPIVARTGRGCARLEEMLASACSDPAPSFQLDYGEEAEAAIKRMTRLLKEETLNKRWLAIQYFQGNRIVMDRVHRKVGDEIPRKIAADLSQKLKEKNGRLTVPQWIHRKRKKVIEAVLADAVQRKAPSKPAFSDRLDAVLTHKWLGLPIFFTLMYLIFYATFNWIGTPVSDQLDAFFSGPLTDWTGAALTSLGVLPFIRDVILDGIIAGVGGVLVFVPQIFVLFFFISWMEDSGYMARVALVMDRFMQMAGLNGKAFIPLVIGFGCNIPGIMAARSIDQPKERLLTILISPLMSCSARLTVYSLFAGVFFKSHQALVVLSLYVLSIAMALIMAKIFSQFMKKERSVFVVELPPYRLPNLRTIIRSTWDKARGFVRKAMTFILGGTVLVWLLSYTGPGGLNVAINHSFLAIVCTAIAPLAAPLGFGTWQAASGLITGFLAKEAVVSTFGIVYSAGGASLTDVVGQAFTPLQAYSFMVFTLLYIPCISTVPAIRHETGTRKLTLLTVGYCVLLAYIVSFIVYHGGLLLGFH
ncbi:ferrous iron transport protein B [Sporolactobacillus sp. THM7-7]|nr:ferrous iron transport protein B [Sporolactobacillus sp. THM7-7]